MDISQAKEQVANTVRAYLATDEFGHYVLPVESMRPVFLMGPPGIGKTAIVKQVASELGIGLVAYSMTHHTRQSALGLPYVTTGEFGGIESRITHYTMSEIVASVFEQVRDTGKEQGILFLDEVNCVSETLAPAMLQFLQFKTFGQHRIPQGWVIVTAGNPPEYNNSVREFDVVTWDRLKRIDIEPDYGAWKAYAAHVGVHPAVTTYLELKKQHFYKVASTAAGKEFVTARGWVDLSAIMAVYEEQGMEVGESLVSQYLQDPDIAQDFARYYQLFAKYKADYQVAAILDGSVGPDIMQRARDAAFDERLALLGMVFDAVSERMEQVLEFQDALGLFLKALLDIRDSSTATPAAEQLAQHAARIVGETQTGRELGTMDRHALRVRERCNALMEQGVAAAEESGSGYERLKELYAAELEALKVDASEASSALDNAFEFLEMVYGEGQEILIFVTNLTASTRASSYIARYGCERYFAHNEELLFYERQKEIIDQLDELDL